MTNRQEREYKLANQLRKLKILSTPMEKPGKTTMGIQHYLGGVPQDGKATPLAKRLFKRGKTRSTRGDVAKVSLPGNV
jgi:hypothetical protein